ncbi:hypothetical protein Acor_01430 [Acrocarpospora corrugata]|uniref:CYTH domain-containing protein n=2 Tax=Acrocarpospora corrugata TaxID=35763 RepID=A0A5M3VR51_9ACTN|nr:hypothetical protein Acor_01430 [Acrocarpospora corrugata]
MVPDRAEIKVTFDGSQIERALTALAPLPSAVKRDVYFCEDVTQGMPTATPLLDIGVILRIRQTPGGKTESTVKLRPCRRSQFPGSWLRSAYDDDPTVKLELDWAGDRRVLAASCTGEPSEQLIEAVSSGDESVGRLFNDEQEQFLQECAIQRVSLRTLTLLPSFIGTRWGPWQPDNLPYDGEIVLERWTLNAALDFLEISVRVRLDDATQEDTALRTALHELGLDPESAAGTKTARVLHHLIEQQLTSGPS